MDIEILEDLGLTKSEIKVYVELLELGSSHAGEILEKADIHHSVLHRALNKLICKGIISFISEGKHKIYTANKPEYFLNFIDDKRKKFEVLLPELKLREKIGKKENTTTMFRGIKGIKEVYSKLINLKEKEMISFGGSNGTTKFMGLPWWTNMHNTRIHNKLSNRHIASDEVIEYVNIISDKAMTMKRLLPEQLYSQYQETVIVGDYVAINIFADDGYSILIKNKEVAQGYKKNFELLWAQAKNIELIN